MESMERDNQTTRMIRLLLFLSLCSTVSAAPLTFERGAVYLTHWEGYRLVPYRDAQSGWSVGVGHSLTAHREQVKSRYTPAEVHAFLVHDFAVALESCEQGITDFDELPLDVQEVCIGVAFGCGARGFERFKSFRWALSRRAYWVAANELGLSKWYHQVSPNRANEAIRVLRAY